MLLCLAATLEAQVGLSRTELAEHFRVYDPDRPGGAVRGIVKLGLTPPQERGGRYIWVGLSEENQQCVFIEGLGAESGSIRMDPDDVEPLLKMCA